MRSSSELLAAEGLVQLLKIKQKKSRKNTPSRNENYNKNIYYTIELGGFSDFYFKHIPKLLSFKVEK